SPVPQPLDRLQRASPFAGGPGGKASWWVQGRSPGACRVPAAALMQVGLISLLDGLVYGMLLFMLASGLTLILSMMGVLNFAHASVYMLGAYFAYQISRWVGFWPAFVIAPLLCGAIGAA